MSKEPPLLSHNNEPVLISADLQAIETYLTHQLVDKSASNNTLLGYRSDLEKTSKWFVKRGVGLLTVTSDDLQEYLVHRVHKGKSERSSARKLSCLRGFFAFLQSNALRLDNPTLDLEQPKSGHSLPVLLSDEQVETLLNEPNIRDIVEARDKAMLELLYACGPKVSELITITCDDLDLKAGVLRLKCEKKVRHLPLGERAIQAIKWYLTFSRSSMLQHSVDTLFVTHRGGGMTRQSFWYRIKLYAQRARIRIPLSPRTLRHAFALHLVSNGMQLRKVQKMLGHHHISTTQIYSEVAASRLKKADGGD